VQHFSTLDGNSADLTSIGCPSFSPPKLNISDLNQRMRRKRTLNSALPGRQGALADRQKAMETARFLSDPEEIEIARQYLDIGDNDDGKRPRHLEDIGSTNLAR